MAFRKAYWLATAALMTVLLPGAALAQAPKAATPTAAKPPAAVGEVVVTGAPPPVRTSIDRRTYTVANDLQATTGSIGDALRNVPSVEVDVQGNISLRGDPNVTILIDGKPSGMFRGEAKAQALQTLPASQIDRVEVITNPSAAFNPEGTAGVINLITKKVTTPGVSGGVRLNAGAAGHQNASGTISRRSGKLTLNTNVYLRHDSLRQSFTSDRTFTDAAGAKTLETRLTGSAGSVDVLSVRSGFDYDLDKRTRISGELRYQNVLFDSDAADSFTRTGPNGALQSAYSGRFGQKQDRDEVEATFGLRRVYGTDHRFDLSISREWDASDRSRPGVRTFATPALPAIFEDSENRTHFRRWQVKADYMRPLDGGTKLKVGYELNVDDDDYRLVFGRGLATGPVSIDPNRSNLFRFDQQVHGAYVTLERPFGKVTALAGLRVEGTFIDIDQATQGVRSENNYVRAYPSLHLGYPLSETQALTASYSRRVQRPGTQDYNPFRVYVDPQNFSQGNPDLKPQETDSFELGYQYRKSGRIWLATLYYRDGRNAVNEVSRDLGGGVILQTKDNIGAFRSAGLELVANGRLPGRLTYNVSTNALWSEIDARGLGAGAGRRSTTALSGRGSLNWQATSDDFLQVQGVASAKALQPQGYREPNYVLNLGYRHKFSETLSFVATAQDVLGTAGFRTRVVTPAYSERSRARGRFRGTYVGLTYSFGGGRQRGDTFDYGGAPPT